ncbi:hypothetical protein BCR43DRAFT_535119 [Syncephalastrum racemosum]|uniref:Ribosome maturation protein SDO1/SBDS N-terminal domain-containing protein n=1 Tax=Syncephalastrum racemosum TaxID=13706 RepID=A0A1X2HUE9_SYNRA|nr:hypothetical protein BCR43DRAFT_535119 [Syncephalastrum racemosum]
MPVNKHRAAKLVVRDNENREYYVIANPGMASKWRNDKTIPLVDVVQSFDVWTSNCYKETGEAIRPPKGMLESAFQTKDGDEMVRQIVERGEEKGM